MKFFSVMWVRVYAEYNPIDLFERNSCFRVNIQTFKKNRVFYTPKMAQKFVFPESELEKFFIIRKCAQSIHRLGKP